MTFYDLKNTCINEAAARIVARQPNSPERYTYQWHTLVRDARVQAKAEINAMTNLELINLLEEALEILNG